MSASFLPTRDVDLLTWAANFAVKILLAPTSYGLTTTQATGFDALNSTYADSYQTSQNPDTRSPSAIVIKDAARKALENNARLLARIIQANPQVTDAQRTDLGLTVRKADPTPVPPPATAPVVEVASVIGRTLEVRLHPAPPASGRGKPAGVHGAAVFSYIGATAPGDINAWHFEGNTNLTKFTVQFADTVAAGTQVYVTAFWFNAKSQSGPVCDPVPATLGGGSVNQAV